jgi:hypothetical protein
MPRRRGSRSPARSLRPGQAGHFDPVGRQLVGVTFHSTSAHYRELVASHLAVVQLDVRRVGVGLVPGVDGWLRFRAWSCSSASPIGGASS